MDEMKRTAAMISVKWSLHDPCTNISTHRTHKYTHKYTPHPKVEWSLHVSTATPRYTHVYRPNPLTHPWTRTDPIRASTNTEHDPYAQTMIKGL